MCQYLPCGMRKVRVITDLLYEQLAKDLLLYYVFKGDTKSLSHSEFTRLCLEKKKIILDFLGPKTDLDRLQDSVTNDP